MAFNDYAQYVKSLRLYASSTVYPDAGYRFHPHSIPFPEQIGLVATVNIPELQNITLLQRTLLNAVDIENQTTLTSVSAPFLTATSGALKIKNNAALASLSLPNFGLPLTGNSGASIALDFSGNALNATDIDNLFNRLALSLSSGHAYYVTINTSGGTNAAPTAASSLARGSLFLTAAQYHISITTN